MPGVTLHFIAAKRVLDHWRDSGERPPFDLDDPGALNAFYHGAIGPDLGYFPGGERVLSDLSHCVRTGALTSQLIRSARTALERAFAWGWLTHVIADREIHPWIGRGVGEVLHGCRGTFVDGSSDPETHLRVEVGVDCWYAARYPDARSVRLRPVFDEVSVTFLQGAYALTYGVGLPKRVFLSSHRSAGRRVGQALSTLWIIGGLMDDRSPSLMLPGVRWLLRRAYQTSALRGISLAYFNPVQPSDWLIDAISQALVAQVPTFLEVFRRGGSGVEDHNLDTGLPLSLETDHVGTRRALQRLAALMADPATLLPMPPKTATWRASRESSGTKMLGT